MAAQYMLTTKIIMLGTIVGISVVISLFIIVSADMSKFAIGSVSAQTNNNNSNATNSTSVSKSTMDLAMSELAKIHLMAANEALMKGNTTAAFTQMNLAYLQLSMLGMKDMRTLNETQAMKFMQSGGQRSSSSSSSSDTKMMVPDNCIIIQGGVLECRDILTGSYSLAK
jgi:hypothetical protein